MECVYKEYCNKKKEICTTCEIRYDNDAYGDILEGMGYKYCDTCGEIIGLRDRCC